jgi:phosphatidate cytidylyltransferase
MPDARSRSFQQGSTVENPTPNPPVRPWPHGPTRFEQRYGNATTRVVVGIIAIPIIVASVWLGGWAFFLFMAAVSTGALLEYYWLTEKRGAFPNKALGVAAGLLLCLAFMHGTTDHLLLRLFSVEQSDLALLLARFVMVLGVLLLFSIAVMIDELFRREGSPIINNIATFAGVTYVSLFLSTLIGLRQLFDGDRPFRAYIDRVDAGLASGTGSFGWLTVVAVLVSIWTCDSAAYYAGRAFGRHKLFERISPKKTWEGAIAGAVAAMLAMLAMQHWLLPYLRPLDAMAIGLMVGVFGQIGDLAESHLKRDAGVKDSSALIPGHGGVFDRFDSLLFVAPLVYVYINLIMLLR